MHFILKAIDFVLHVNVYLKGILAAYGAWTYALLFLIIFMETGFVITPFLPGDSLIFAAGALAPAGSLNVFALYLIFAAAAIGGDTTNYWIGHAIGERAFTGEIKWIKKEYMDRAHTFFEKHGGMAIILGRFVPIIRTFVPFVTGISEMPYGQFIRWDVTGGLLWVAIFLTGGYTLGNNAWVQNHFSVVIVIIVLISVVPALVEGWKVRSEGKRLKQQSKAGVN